ncbi:hypothetical protein HMP0721_1171 [Pseudoramibacter alactolyticus ATCC 23263]|uniref:Uncharacterized protein n=1 Tax=Pseudoramibacter alactolyticus ATCC 23263 TaxID=887929 RepID=E6MGN8_9FIRM|nr:hypothetical protein HMP0721_1171 [Pseudoramibacter alactolyticus ATCC 23263]
MAPFFLFTLIAVILAQQKADSHLPAKIRKRNEMFEALASNN